MKRLLTLGARVAREARRLRVVPVVEEGASPTVIGAAAALRRLRGLGCVLVDTTCGSVLNVWKRVESYARDGFTALIHGKYFHEETRATASQVNTHPNGKYIVVRDMDGYQDLLLNKITRISGVTGVHTSFVLRKVVDRTAMPLGDG